MPEALIGLANHTVSGTSTTSVTFSSIVGTYRDLVLVINGTNSVDANLYMRFNSDSGTNYDLMGFSGVGNTQYVTSGSSTGIFFNNYARIGTTPASFVLNIFDYAQTDKYKTTLSKSNKGSNAVEQFLHRWNSNSAITSISCTVASGYMVAGTTLTLYGISA